MLRYAISPLGLVMEGAAQEVENAALKLRVIVTLVPSVYVCGIRFFIAAPLVWTIRLSFVGARTTCLFAKKRTRRCGSETDLFA